MKMTTAMFTASVSIFRSAIAVAQTGQFFDVYHCPGNAHDSNGADEFMLNCFTEARTNLKNTVFESRMDSAIFNQKILSFLNYSAMID